MPDLEGRTEFMSSVCYVCITELKDCIENHSTSCKTLLVWYDGIYDVTCLFLSVSDNNTKSLFILNWSTEGEREWCRDELSRLPPGHCTIYSLDSRTNLHLHPYFGGALAIEDAFLLYISPTVQHIPDSRTENWGSLAVNVVKHAPGSPLLLYSQGLASNEMERMLGDNSPYIWLINGEHKNLLLPTYHCLHKLNLMYRIFEHVTS